MHTPWQSAPERTAVLVVGGGVLGVAPFDVAAAVAAR
jgi:hypothetical protein